MSLDRESFILITLDSCRFDTYKSANTPNLDKVGPVHRAYAPGNFTLPSHMAMFCGFTPGDPKSEEDFVNPKYKRLWKLGDDVQPGKKKHLMTLPGFNIVDGFNKLGYETIGTGGVGWFDPARIASKVLIDKFKHFSYFGQFHYLPQQVEWIKAKLDECRGKRKFIFMNIGETHGPYWHEGADWDKNQYTISPFGKDNDRKLCEERQRKCLEFADSRLAELLELVKDYNIIICGDHGDAWGEDGLWEHSIHHEKVYEVPLILKVNKDVDYDAIFQNVKNWREDYSDSDQEVKWLKSQLLEREKKILEKENEVIALNRVIEDRDNRLRALLESHSWKITAPVRALGKFFKR